MKKSILLLVLSSLGVMIPLVLWLVELIIGSEPLKFFIVNNWYWFIIVAAVFMLLWLLLPKLIPSYLEVTIFLPREKKESSFWKEFSQLLALNLGDINFNCRTVYPKRGYNEQDYIDELNDQSNWKRSDGAIICSPNSENILECIKGHISEGKKIVLHDLAKDDALWNVFGRSNLIQPPLVTINNEMGGRLAAKIAYSYFADDLKNGKTINCVIIPGHDRHTHSIHRVNGFEEELRLYQKKGANIHVIRRTNAAHWNRKGAREVMAEFVESQMDLLASGRLELHIIFACNDEIADGVEKYIKKNILGSDSVQESVKEKFKRIKIIGFDATKKIKDELNENGEFIIGSIDSYIEQQARITAHLIRDVINGSIIRQPDPIEPGIIVSKNFEIVEV